MNLLDRIKSYLTTKNEWVHTDQIYVLARQHGYQQDAIKRSLNTISHTPPFASYFSTGDDTKEPRARGTWYRWHNMTPAELTRNQQGLDAFDAL